MHELEMKVPWAHCDPYDHLNHAQYLTYFETARIEALEWIGWGMQRLREEGLMILVADIRVRFLKAANFQDTFTIATRTVDLRAASSHWHQVMTRDGETLAKAEVVGAITNLAGRPVRIPEALHKAMSQLLPEEAG